MAAVIVVVVLIIVVVVVVVVVLRRRRRPAIESKYYTTLLYVSPSYYSASASLIGEPSIVMSEYVCLFVCPFVRDHIPGTTSSNFTTFFAHLLWPWLGFSMEALLLSSDFVDVCTVLINY